MIDTVHGFRFRFALRKHDQLTGLPASDSWQGRARREEMRARRAKQPLCVALLAVEHFGSFQTIHGRDAADELLMAAAHAWRSQLRAGDYLVRFGSEFALLLPDCGLGQAVAILEQLKASMPARRGCHFGVAEWDGSEAIQETLGRASMELLATSSDQMREARLRAGHALS